MPFFPLEGIYICIYLQPCPYLHSQEYSVRNTKVLRKKLLKMSSRLRENWFRMVRPESPVLVIQRQLGRVLPKLRVQKSSRTGRFRKVGFWGEAWAAGHCQTSVTQLLTRELSCLGVGSLLAVCPQNQSHFLGGPRGGPVSCFWHSRGGKKPNVGPTEAPPTLIFHIHDET